MTQLKTLKDMEKEHEKYTDEDRLVVADEVKQEAIKWIKCLQEREKGIIATQNEVPEYGYGVSEAIAWIKHFFNITDEDLK